MSHVFRTSYEEPSVAVSEQEMKKKMSQRKWKTVRVAISEQDLKENFTFLNDAVVLRPSREDVPLMTTTAIYGPIRPGTMVALTPGMGTGVLVEPEECRGTTLIEELDELAKITPEPDSGNAVTVNAKWVSSKDGGAIPGLGSASNVFGATGSLFVNQSEVVFPVLDVGHREYDRTLAYYGAKRLRPNESFCMGFDKLLFGMEYDTRLPGYIRDYAMEPFGGGGLFVEHHPFPHIFQPKPDYEGHVFCESKIILGRESAKSKKDKPLFTFTIFRIPADGSAIAIRPGTIHNDSYTNGRQTVFVANTPADTVALRETSPFRNIMLEDQAD